MRGDRGLPYPGGMGNATLRRGSGSVRLGLLGALVMAAPACANDTGIVLEISLSAELTTALDESGENFEKLRVWVGRTTSDPALFAGEADAYFTTAKTRADLATPFRYLLEPSSEELGALGSMVFAAAVGDDPDDARLPFRLTGFAVADQPMDFAAGEIRVVPLALLPPDGASGTIDDACIVWGMNTQQPSRITPIDDLDCDGAVGDADCDDRDPSRNNLDVDGDSFTSCGGDCMDDPDDRVPWLDPSTVHPGALDPEESSLSVCEHVDQNCNGLCQAATLDRDGSGATTCGQVMASHGVCAVLPADCDENFAGQQANPSGAAEACNGRDDGCDGFLPPALPCIIPDLPGKCYFGEVKCDELRGEYVGEPGALDCKRLPGSFSDVTAPATLCAAMSSPSCLEADDPVGCALGTSAFGRASCTASVGDAVCPPDRTPLSFPGVTLPATCAWHVVGGTAQAEWEVGFVTANAAANAVPMPTIGECTPHLAARSRVRNPVPRTVMLLLMSPQNPTFGARPLLLNLSVEGGGAQCAGDLTCQFVAGN